ncbi:O-antigen ligase family protein [Flavobacterium sp. KACC 22763]|uniref:O-antigen ligase family protein n=1 Tax=Flavobacterium sp. KACC 22763 TaxID=3025668 RepID=UPI0023655DD7|nr:O-antigen ligase family protein [Flavobacterium sp. KACC 22763]WDF63510.1 O-antigen ligase family protein [Flavobacterium sp. KACC 22763]
MKIPLSKIYLFFFFLGLFFFSFNEYQGLSFLGEFKTESGALFFLLGFLLLGIESIAKGKISIPYKSTIFQILVFFLIWCFITTVLNANTVVSNYFKHTSGINRFVRQYFSMILSCVVFFLFYWNVIYKMKTIDILLKIRKVFLLSLIIAFTYGFFEVLVVVFGFGKLYSVLKLFDFFPFLEVSLQTGGRISSIAYEPPFLAIYLITISGWMFSYILTEKGLVKFLPAFAVLFLTYFSGSRTGLIVVLFQVCIFCVFLYRDPRFKSYLLKSFLAFTIVFCFLLLLNGTKIVNAIGDKIDSLDFRKNLTKNVSNQSRFGMQYAALQVFSKNPIIGVGFGQQGYHVRTHYPSWATRNNYEFELLYKNKNEKSFPPGYNIYTRLLAETGLIGFSLFLMLIFFSLVEVRKLMKTAKDEDKILLIIILISLSGLYVNWLQIDTFRMYGVWLSLAILIRMRYKPLKFKDE